MNKMRNMNTKGNRMVMFYRIVQQILCFFLIAFSFMGWFSIDKDIHYLTGISFLMSDPIAILLFMALLYLIWAHISEKLAISLKLFVILLLGLNAFRLVFYYYPNMFIGKVSPQFILNGIQPGFLLWMGCLLGLVVVIIMAKIFTLHLATPKNMW
jgi:hypothetical protein